MTNLQNLIKEMDYSINDFDDPKESNLWFHRARGIIYYINYDSFKNGLPLILTYEEIMDAKKDGITINDCDSTSSLFDDDRISIIEKLNSKGIAYEFAFQELKNRYLKDFGNYFDEGLYTRYIDLSRTATQCTEKGLQKILNSDNMGWNINRGYINVGFLLDIPTYYLQNYEALIEKAQPKEIATEYYGINVIDTVIPGSFIKEMIIKEGNEIIRVKNPNYDYEYIPNKKARNTR